MSLDSLVGAFFKYTPSEVDERIEQFQRHLADVQMRSRMVLDNARLLQESNPSPDLSAFAIEISHLAEQRYRIGLELHRLGIVRSYDKRIATDHLRKSYFDEAQIVFTTLSSSCSRFLLDMNCMRSFDVCIVDEAAQWYTFPSLCLACC
jgi:hypothetical protein